MEKKEKLSFLKKYINGTKGVISLFLAILMVPFLTIAGALINAARLNSAVSIFDEALCNASNSVLGTYDEFLRDRFGLMALSQDLEKYAGQLGESAVTYSSEDFLQELFVYYMEENLGALTDTYDSSALSAVGIYPLGDTKVLRSAILQTSKITVPAKMVVEWGQLEDFMAMLTKPFKLFESIADTLSSGTDVVADIDKLTDTQEELEAQIEACNTVRSEYNTAYDNFATAVSNFNTLIGNISSAQATVNDCQDEVDRLNALVSDINADIAKKEKKIGELQKDKNVDHSQEISALEEEIKELKKKRNEEAPGYDDAVEALEDAKETLKNYENQFSGKRNDVISKKATYRAKIVALQEALNATKELAVDFQTAAKDLVSHATDLITNATKTGLEAAKTSCDKNMEQLKEENKEYQQKYEDAVTSTNPEAAAYYQNCIKENNEAIAAIINDKNKYENSDEIVSSALGTMQDVSGDLTNFANRDLTAEYEAIYDSLTTCRNNLDNVIVPSDYARVSYTKSNVYVTVTNPISKGAVSEIVENIEDQIVNNGGWAILQTIFGFFSALMDLKLNWDSNLSAEIDESLYSANGGLPSKKTAYSLNNPYSAVDGALSLAYKETLNSYSAEDVYEIPGKDDSQADKIEEYINTIQDNIKPFKLKNIKKLWDAAKGLIGELIDMGAEIVEKGVKSLLTGLRDRFYIVGYASYYMANRTTFQGVALTGTGFNLPQHGTDEGYVFSGAELEYIYKGNLKETKNQSSAFNAIWIERMLFNVFSVVKDPLVQSLGAALGSFTFGLGDVLVKLAFLVAESYLDCVLLVNQGKIPIIKSSIYLSPTGFLKLVKEILSLNLSEATKKKIYNASKDAATNINNKTNELATKVNTNYTSKVDVSYSEYDTYKEQQDKADEENKFRDIFTMDYTKSLQVFMLFFGNNEKYVKRIADIIQMEASYKAHQGLIKYEFNLDKSYTYIRASGIFSSGVFMKVGEDESYTSKSRVIYNGY